MAQPIENPEEFAEKLEAVTTRPEETRPRLLAFLLFDERQSHRLVQDFVRQQFDWLDRLAASSRMVLFFFLPGGAPKVEPSEGPVFAADAERTVANPSLIVARRFDLRPSELPGVVFFTELDINAPGPHDGVFWPLPTELFEGGGRQAEDEFSFLFELVQNAERAAAMAKPSSSPAPRRSRFLFGRTRSGSPNSLLAELRKQVESVEREARMRPVMDALRNGSIKAVKFPGALAEATSIAFGQELARRIVPG